MMTPEFSREAARLMQARAFDDLDIDDRMAVARAVQEAGSFETLASDYQELFRRAAAELGARPVDR